MEKKITFEEMPETLQRVLTMLSEIHCSLKQKESQPDLLHDQYFDLAGLLNYLPGRPAKQTIYGKIHRREIPFGKQHGRLYFIKSDIDQWLEEGQRKTKFQIASETSSYIKTKSSQR